VEECGGMQRCVEHKLFKIGAMAEVCGGMRRIAGGVRGFAEIAAGVRWYAEVCGGLEAKFCA